MQKNDLKTKLIIIATIIVVIITIGLYIYKQSKEDTFEEYGVTHVIIHSNGKLNLLLAQDDNYNCIYTDKNFKIYERLNSGYSDSNEM